MYMCAGSEARRDHLLDVDGHHVLQHPGPQPLAPVGHGAVLDGPREHHHVPRLALHLDHVGVEVLHVVGVAGLVVGVGPDARAAVFFGEI